MKINFASFFLKSIILVLLCSPNITFAQQPKTNPTSPQNIDPSTMTKDQIRQVIDQKQTETDRNQKDGTDKNKNADDAETGKEKKEEVIDEEITFNGNSLDLPIFGNEIFNRTNSNFQPSTNRPTPENYVLGPGDKLEIDVTGNSVVSWTLTVNPDGSILLPGMGKLNLGGKTIENGTLAIEERLRANRYAIGNGTNVSVSLTNIRTIRITVMGEVKSPGDKSVSSLTTVFNALYESGGITNTGSFRAIEVVRNNEKIAIIDMYDYLLRGDLSSNITLRDGDVIRVPEYRVRVSMQGEVKRSAYYEVMPGESLKDVVNFSGGFSDYAYKFNIKSIQLTSREQRIKDIPESEIESYIPLKGDKYFVDKILERYENRVTILGSVYRPGEYELSDALTLRELITKADGLKEDAYTERGYITRLNEDNSSEIIPFFVKSIVDGKSEDILLKREDVISISSIFDYTDAYTVTINGKVRNGGTFPYFNGMTVEDLILKSGGFADGANMQRVDIARRVKDSDKKAKDAKLAKVYTITIDSELKLAQSKFKLEPFDIISIFSLPGFVAPQMVTIEGEVMLPGTYAMISKDDRISDLIARAEGFTAYAYLDGASLKREDLIETQADEEKQALKMEQFRQKQREATDGKLDLDLMSPSKRNNFVDIDLKNIMKYPKGKKDIILMDGDILSIPRELQTVKVSGEVYSPKTTVFNDRESLNSYVLRSGGYTENALKRDAYVVYSNGASKGTKKFLFFKNYPNIEPGAEIFIPKKAPSTGKDLSTIVQTYVGLTASIASLAALIFAITNNSN